MTETLPIFQDLFLVWLVGLLGGLVAYRLKQPLVLGYMLGGLLASPFTPGPSVQDVETIQLLADFGVVLLMFSLGIELAPVGLRRIGRTSLLVGVFKTVILVLIVLAFGWGVHWSVAQRLVIGFALSVSSTMVVTKMLMERQELKTEHGQTLLGITIVEDCVMMGFLLFLPLVADRTQWQPMMFVWVSMKVIGFLALIFTLGIRVVPRLLSFISRTHNEELSVLVLLAIAMGIGVISVWSGLSLALGAFVAGLVLSGSETTTQTMGRMLPMRDLFVITFFVSLGVLLDLSVVVKQWPLLLGLLAFVLGLKWVINTWLCLVFGCEWPIAWRVGVGLSQIGEFSIVLCTIARQLNMITLELYHIIIAVSLLSILVNTFIFNLIEQAPQVFSLVRKRRFQ